MRLTHWPETVDNAPVRRRAHKRKTDKPIWHVRVSNTDGFFNTRHAKPSACRIVPL